MQRLGDVRAPISCHKSRWTYHRGSCSELKYFKGVEEWKTNLMSLANFFFFTSYVLSMFRTLIYPSSGACDCIVDLPHRSSCSQFAVCWSFGAAGFGWCSFCRLKLQPAKRTLPKTSRTKSSNIQRTENKTTDVVIQQHSRKLLMMDILMSETCWAHKKCNKIASDIKLVFHSSTITMMHGPINLRFWNRWFILREEHTNIIYGAPFVINGT